MANTKKVALITGANKGLGYEMAKQLAQSGVIVVLAARDRAKGEAAVEKLKKEGLDVQFLKLDVTNKKDYAEAAAFLEKNFGKLDILINNAGISADGLAGTSVSAVHIKCVGRMRSAPLRFQLVPVIFRGRKVCDGMIDS